MQSKFGTAGGIAMNDRYLFRAKRADNAEWVEGNYECDPDGDNHYICGFDCYLSENGLEREFFTHEVNKDTICQCTGLNDKNGRLIWENDIVKFDDEVWSSSYTSCGTEYDSCEVENYGVVGYCDYEARYDFVKYKFNENSVEADLHENHDIEFVDFLKEHEVVGNIFDNPELLKVEE